MLKEGMSLRDHYFGLKWVVRTIKDNGSAIIQLDKPNGPYISVGETSKGEICANGGECSLRFVPVKED